jgi:hypothetical protein
MAMSSAVKCRWVWAIGLGVTSAYAVVNARAVLMPFIPHKETLFAWGLAFPAAMIAAIWLCLAITRELCASWWKLGLFLSACHTALGLLSWWLICEMWAAV